MQPSDEKNTVAGRLADIFIESTIFVREGSGEPYRLSEDDKLVVINALLMIHHLKQLEPGTTLTLRKKAT